MLFFTASSSTLSGTTAKTQMQPYGLLVFVVVTLLQLTSAQQAALSSTAPSLVHGGPTTNVPTNCTIVRPLFLARGINSADIPNAANHGKLYASFSFTILCHSFRVPNSIEFIQNRDVGVVYAEARHRGSLTGLAIYFMLTMQFECVVRWNTSEAKIACAKWGEVCDGDDTTDSILFRLFFSFSFFLWVCFLPAFNGFVYC